MNAPRRRRARCYVAIGTNVGDRTAHLVAACVELAAIPRTRLTRRSRVRETDPVGTVPQGPFLNAVVELETGLGAEELLGKLLAIEMRRGRDRHREQRWGPRTLDLDLLMYAQMVVRTERLTLPHPRMAERRFVLEPLAELAPDLVVPGTEGSVRLLLERLGDGTCAGSP